MENKKGSSCSESEMLSKKLEYSTIVTQVGFLQGKVLTIIDASYTEGRQLEAIKGLIKGTFRDQLDWMARLSYPNLPVFSRSEWNKHENCSTI